MADPTNAMEAGAPEVTPFPVKRLTGALLLLVIVLIGMTWAIYSSYRKSDVVLDRSLRMEELCGIIVHLDEVLTMSARMAATTGDPVWENRHLQFEPRLDAAVQEAVHMGNQPVGTQAAAQTDAANIKLVEMEKQAFAFIREGRLDQAKTVLSSKAYETQKKIYAEGMVKFIRQLKNQLAAVRQEERRAALAAVVVATISLVLLFVIWLTVLGRLNQWRRHQVLSFQRLSRADRELKKSFDSMEDRVKERTWELQQEIAERKQAEQQLEIQVKAMKSAANAIVITHPDGTIMWVNPAFTTLTGYTEVEAVGQNPSLLKSGEHGGAFYRKLWETISSGKVWNGELVNRRKDGGFYTEEMTITPVHAADGRILRYIAIKQNTTERKQAERERAALEVQLRHSQKLEAIGQLAAGIAHEINTPTQYINDNTRFVQDAFQDVKPAIEQSRRLLEAAKQNAVTGQMVQEVEAVFEAADLDYLLAEAPKAIQQSLDGVQCVSKIVQAMKEFSRPGSETKTAVSLNRAIESTITVARNEWKYVSNMVTDFDPELPPVPCLPGEFNQVVLNILINAAHAIADVVGDGQKGKGTISVSTRQVNGSAEVRISDTGTGISEAARARIYDPFFTTKPVGRGTGQGLAIARSVVVDKHGGDITFETELGKGTTFIIRLPLHSG